MRIYVADILKTNGASLNVGFYENLDGLNSNAGIDLVFDSPVSFLGRVTNIKGVLSLGGHVKADYKAKCFRCLKELESSVEADIKEQFINALNKTDDEAYNFEGNYINIDKALIDNIIISLPMRHACSKTCKGLCPVCGANLNETTCGCKIEQVSTNMERLKIYLKADDKSGS